MKTLAFLSLFLIISCKNIGGFAGSYPFAETYTIHSSEDEVIERLIKLKEEDTNFIVPKFPWRNTEVELKDERKSHWYVFYFYLKERDQILYLWTREAIDSNYTTVAIIRVSNGLNLGNWKTINKDLSDEEDDEIKKVFEETILSKIKGK